MAEKEDMKMLPMGYHFRPTDEQLVQHYLLGKIKGNPVRGNIIKECEIYGEKSPWELFDQRKTNYVFTKLTKVGKSRFSRKAGCGTWHGQDTEGKPIHDPKNKNRVVGFKKTFTFKVKKNNDKASSVNTSDVSNWIMHEYSLADHGDFTSTLCKVEKSRNKNGSVRKSEQEEFCRCGFCDQASISGNDGLASGVKDSQGEEAIAESEKKEESRNVCDGAADVIPAKEESCSVYDGLPDVMLTPSTFVGFGKQQIEDEFVALSPSFFDNGVCGVESQMMDNSAYLPPFDGCGSSSRLLLQASEVPMQPLLSQSLVDDGIYRIETQTMDDSVYLPPFVGCSSFSELLLHASEVPKQELAPALPATMDVSSKMGYSLLNAC